MADPRSASTRRVFLSYSHLEELTGWPELMIEDYQAIQQDFTFTADELDAIDVRVTFNEESILVLDERVTVNEADIINLQDSRYPNLSSQVQWLQQQIDGLPEFTIDTIGFTFDGTELTFDKVIA